MIPTVALFSSLVSDLNSAKGEILNGRKFVLEIVSISRGKPFGLFSEHVFTDLARGSFREFLKD